MSDLSNSIFYKIKFQISNAQPNDDPLQKIVDHIKDWLLSKWNRRQKMIPDGVLVWDGIKDGGILKSYDNKSVYMESSAFHDDNHMTFWACRISENKPPKAEYAPREWITEIGVEPVEEGKVYFSCVISYVDRPGFIGQCEKEPEPNIPNLIKNILADSALTCIYGNDTVTIDPVKLTAGMWLPFWERALNKERVVPYIYISLKRNQDTGEWSHLVDPSRLAIAAGGNAIVLFEGEHDVIDEMNYYCPEAYKCYGGAIRVYFPNLIPDDPLNVLRHRYISSSAINTFGESNIIQMIRRALAQDIHFYESFFRIDDCRKKQESYARQVRLKELTQKHEAEKEQIKETTGEEVKRYFELAVEEEEKRILAEEKLAEIQNENKLIKETNYNLSVEIDGYRSLAAKNAELERVCNNRLATKQYPSSPIDVTNYFDSLFGDRIAFSDDALASLKRCEIPLEDIWKTFYALATHMRDLYAEGSGDIFAQFKLATGIDVSRGEGSMTRKDNKLMRQFTTEYNNQLIDIEPHITFPRLGQSIHFGYSEKDSKIIIGSCGEHKVIYSTQKHK